MSLASFAWCTDAQLSNCAQPRRNRTEFSQAAKTIKRRRHPCCGCMHAAAHPATCSTVEAPPGFLECNISQVSRTRSSRIRRRSYAVEEVSQTFRTSQAPPHRIARRIWARRRSSPTRLRSLYRLERRDGLDEGGELWYTAVRQRVCANVEHRWRFCGFEAVTASMRLLPET